jgi:hypothetical protein
MKKAVCFACLFVSACLAWDGYDWDSGSYVEIGKGNLVRSGRDIEIYDYGDGRYKDVEVQSIRKTYSGKVEVEVYDPQSHKTRTLEMDSYQDRKEKARGHSYGAMDDDDDGGYESR